jgi:hypothetical protein
MVGMKRRFYILINALVLANPIFYVATGLMLIAAMVTGAAVL